MRIIGIWLEYFKQYRHQNHQIALTARISLTLSLSPSLSLFIQPYRPLLPVVLPDCIRCPPKADVHKFLLVGQHFHIHMKRYIEEHRLWIRPCFFSSVLHVSLVLFGWFWRWEVSGRTAVFSWGVAFRTYSI